jgi:hypothetical protein
MITNIKAKITLNVFSIVYLVALIICSILSRENIILLNINNVVFNTQLRYYLLKDMHFILILNLILVIANKTLGNMLMLLIATTYLLFTLLNYNECQICGNTGAIPFLSFKMQIFIFLIGIIFSIINILFGNKNR